MGNWALAPLAQTYEWVAECGKCKTGFGYTTDTPEQPFPHGNLCPECRKRKLIVVGVLSFKRVRA